mgnify:CR=1 FL=1
MALRLVWILKLPLVWLAHELLLARLRFEGWLTTLDGPPASPRVIASASWTFPVYSQTFVHHEVWALARSGAPVRFLYPRPGPRRDLADTCDGLWKLKRRVLLHAGTGARDLARFRRRMPARVEAVTRLVADAADLREEELMGHEHFLQAFSFARAVEDWRADYLHSYFFYEQTLFALVASQLLGIPRGVSCYSDHMLKDYPLKVVKLHLRTCDVIVATSRRIREELETLHGAPLPQLVVKPNATETAAFRPGSRSVPMAGRPLRLLCVCRIDAKKGIEYLIDAVHLLIGRGVPADLDIVGEADRHAIESGVYEAALRRRAAELGLGHAIRFVGRRTSREVRGFLEKADVFVAPYVDLASGDKDGIPTAVLEAMAAGSVIVATDAGSILEVIEHGRQGLIVPQRDADSLAAAVERVRGDEALARRLRAGAAESAHREYEITRAEALFHERVRGAVLARPRPT